MSFFLNLFNLLLLFPQLNSLVLNKCLLTSSEVLTLMIQAVYVISPSGIPICYVDVNEKEDKIKETTLFAGIISAVDIAMKEIEGGNVKLVETGKNNIFVDVKEKFVLAIVCEKNMNIDKEDLEKVSTKIGANIEKESIFFSEYDDYDPKVVERINTVIKHDINELKNELVKRKAAKRIAESFW